MKKFLADLFQRVTSRKFIVAVLGAITLASNGQWNEFTLLILGYLTAEGAGDVVERFKGGVGTLNSYVNPESHNTDDSDIDTSSVVSGRDDIPLFYEELKESSD